ncbi:Predicted arabinose efflux permease, MFS family [Halorubrum aquaticum]|uniref:Predicted arabinose efflux permease, MFS family n=1 Tax=Halorubrum aquaticum TaxID=387340 RepID=A0A1I2Z1B4_9EURY|nr:MFS transporter [Halorubrum aquaticum]SFH30781.1 Predicted arabinose efflux permease, MFS family [Halorubrum aquaticum]
MVSRFWRIVAAVTVWHVAASVCYYTVYAGTPLFQDAFDLTGLEVGIVIAALTLGYAVSLLPFGIATDRFGERRTLTVGLVGLSVGVFGVAIAPTYPLLLIAAFLLGSMYGSATPGTNKAIFDRIDPGRQHRAIGIKQIGPTIGSAVGALLVTGTAGVLFPRFGFLVAAAVGSLVAVVFFSVYRRESPGEATSPDFRALSSNSAYLVLLLSGVCLGAAFYTTTGYVTLFVGESIGASVAVAGAVLASMQVVSSAGKVAVGTLADVLPGSARTRTGGILAVQAAGGGVLYFVLPASESVLAAGVVFAGIGALVLGSTGLYYSCLSTLVDDDELGAASAAGQLAVTASGLFAPPTFGYLVDVSGYSAAWSFLGVLSLAAAGLTLVVVTDAV